MPWKPRWAFTPANIEMSLKFNTAMQFTYGVPDAVTEDVARLVAPNSGPLTFKGTNTYLVGERTLAVIDPGPDSTAHLDAILAAAAGRPITHIISTHAHRDHVDGIAALKAATGAETYAFRRSKIPEGGGGDTEAEFVGHEFIADVHVEHGDVIEGDGLTANALDVGNHLTARLQALATAHPERITVAHLGRGGPFAARNAGLTHARGNFIAFLDADLEIHPQYVKRFLERLHESGADLVIGTKVPKLGQMPFLRRAMSLIYREFVSLLFGLSLRETQTGIKLFRREVLEDCIPRLRVSRFAFDVELMVAAARFGYRIVEFPVEVGFKRASSLQRIKPRQIAGQLWDTLLIYYMASFWNWFQPGPVTKMWMAAFVLGVFLAGIGAAKLITPLMVAPPLKKVIYYLFLQFLPPALRDTLLVIAGGALMLVSLNELNKSLLNAFARLDRGDLAGIFRSKKTSHQKPRDEDER
jgi:glycosyltransferase involved in cell wall biosynthesis